jgi:CHAD domain-containing protein
MDDTATHHTLGVEAALHMLGEAGLHIGASARTHRVLLDSFDGRLYAAGVIAEHRDGSVVVSQAGSPTVALATDQVPRRAADLPPGPLRQRLGELLEERALLELIAVDGEAIPAERRNAEGKAVATVTVTTGALDGATWVAEISELRGHEGRAAEIAEALASIGARPSSGGLLHLAARAAGVDVNGIDLSPTVDLDPHAPSVDGFGAALRRLDEAIEATWDGTIAEIDVEFLHDLRVAIRRTRSVLASAKGVLFEAARVEFADEFRWLGSITSRVRDLDVYLLEWPGYAAELDPEIRPALGPVRDHLEQHCRAAHAELVTQLGTARAVQLRRRWSAWLEAPAGGKRAERALGKVVARRVERAQQRVLEDGRAIASSSPPEALHDLRKRAKRLRYLLECFGGLAPGDLRKSFVRTLKGLQDNLGEFQDTAVHAAELRSIAHELSADPAGAPTDTILALGQLRERLDGRRATAREEFAARFAAYDTKATRKLLGELTEAMRG